MIILLIHEILEQHAHKPTIFLKVTRYRVPFMPSCRIILLKPHRVTGRMTAKRKLNPLFFAPFVSSVLRIEPDWIDGNGHLNMAYYNVLFERAIDEAFELVGLNDTYYSEGPGTIFIGEAHLRYRQELYADSPVRVTVQLIDYDSKRLHLYLEMRHSSEGWLAATSELMALHIDKTQRKVAPFPSDILDAIAIMQSAHKALPRPEHLGSTIEIPAHSSKGKVGLH